jgi:hypothetical protein
MRTLCFCHRNFIVEVVAVKLDSWRRHGVPRCGARHVSLSLSKSWKVYLGLHDFSKGLLDRKESHVKQGISKQNRQDFLFFFAWTPQG